MGRQGYVPLRRLGGVPLRGRWMFYLRLLCDGWRRTDGTLLLRPLEKSLLRSNKTLWGRTTETTWRPSTEKSLGVSFEIYVRRQWDIQRDAVTASPRNLVAGWEVI